MVLVTCFEIHGHILMALSYRMIRNDKNHVNESVFEVISVVGWKVFFSSGIQTIYDKTMNMQY